MSTNAWGTAQNIVEAVFGFLVFGILGVVILGNIMKWIAKISKSKNAFINFFRRPLTVYTINRTGKALFTIFLVLTATFLLLRLLPEETYYIEVANKLPEASREAYIARVRRDLGFDKRLIEQLFNYYYQLLPIPKKIGVGLHLVPETGELVYDSYKTVYTYFGVSFNYQANSPVLDIIFEKATVSFIIGIIAVAIEMIIAYPLGVIMAMRKDKIIDKLGKAYTILVDSIPALVYFLLLLFLFQRLGLSIGFRMDNAKTWIAPIISLVIAGIPGIAIWVRRYMVDEMNSDYVKFARAKGLSNNRIMFVHVLRNAVVPLVRTFPSAVLFALTGSYFIENLYSIPGLGQTLIKAVGKQDNNVVLALVIIYAFISTVAYLIGDILTALADPRVSLTEEE